MGDEADDVRPATPLAPAAAGPDVRPARLAAPAPAADVRPAVALPPPTAGPDVRPARPAPDEEARLREANVVRPEEIDALKQRYPKADTEMLKSVVPYLGAHTTEAFDPVESAKRVVGLLGRAGLNVPQFLAKKAAGSELLGGNSDTEKAWDELQELASSRRTTGQKVGEFAAELLGGGAVIPGLGAVAGGAKEAISGAGAAGRALAVGAAEGAAIGAVGHVANSKRGEETQGLGIAAALGGALGAGAHLLTSAVAQKAGQQIVVRTDQAMQAPEMQTALQDGLRAVQEAGSGQPLSDAAQAPNMVGFAAWLKSPGRLPAKVADLPKPETVDGALDSIQQWQAGKGSGALEKAYEAFSRQQVATELMADQVARGYGVDTSWWSKLGRMNFRTTAQMGIIDDRAGTTLGPAADRLAMQGHMAAREVYGHVQDSAELLQEMRGLDLHTLGADAIRDIEAGEQGALSADQQRAVGRWTDLMERLRVRANALAGEQGLTREGEELVTKVEGAPVYVPHMQMDAPGTIAAVTSLARRAGRAAGVDLLDKAADISDEAFERVRAEAPEAWGDLSEALRYLSGEHPETAADLQRMLRQTVDPDGLGRLSVAKAMGRTAGSFLERGEQGVPDSLRETDLVKLTTRWMDSAFREVYTGQTIRDMVAQRGLLHAANDSAGVEYLDSWLADISGGRVVPKWIARRRAATVADLTTRADAAEEAGQAARAATLRTLATNADLPSVMMASLYPNLMGFKPSSVLKPLLAPFTSTMPELMAGGAAWGGAKIAGGVLRTLEQLATSPKSTIQMLTERGWMPTKMTAEASDAWRSGFTRGPISSAVRKGLDAWSTLALSGMQAGESVNRLIAINSARGIAEELARGGPEAMRFVDQLGVGYRTELGRLQRAGDVQGMQQLLEQYIVSKTLQHYSPYHMNELGRHFGRIVGALSTWPSAVSGDIVRDYARSGAVGGTVAVARKYLAPWAALMGMQHLLNVGGWDPDHPRAKLLLGSQGLAGAAPAHELRPPAGPAVGDAGAILKGVATMDPSAWWKAANAVGEHYTPVLPAMVHLLDNVWTLQRGQAPGARGETVTGRALDLAKPGRGQALDEYIQERYGRSAKQGGQK